MLGNQTLFSEAEGVVLFVRISRLCNFQKWNFIGILGYVQKKSLEGMIKMKETKC